MNLTKIMAFICNKNEKPLSIGDLHSIFATDSFTLLKSIR